MDVRKRPNWLKSAENKTFAPKPQRLAVVPPSTTEDDEEDKNNDVGSSTVLVEVSNEQEGDIDHRAGSTLEQFETLKQRQQEQMQALLLQQTQVSDSLIVLPSTTPRPERLWGQCRRTVLCVDGVQRNAQLERCVRG